MDSIPCTVTGALGMAVVKVLPSQVAPGSFRLAVEGFEIRVDLPDEMGATACALDLANGIEEITQQVRQLHRATKHYRIEEGMVVPTPCEGCEVCEPS